ncbi:glycosyltransferase family 1 protein [Thioclava sp. GXIMD4215]|uniref:glycosyltransferase family 4 protein n=1 Tax=Thioclava sp. GXIMD4215 TaxID=3131928 RepID=UPI00311AD506
MTPAPRRLVLNARFLTQAQSGVQRYAHMLMTAFDRLLEHPSLAQRLGPVTAYYPADAGLQVTPAWRHITLEPLPCRWPGGGHIWEQTALARAARGGYLLNLTGSGPALHRDQLLVIHDANIWHVPDAFSRRYRGFHKTLRPVLARRARDLATVSQFSAQELAQVLDQPELRFRVIPNGADHLVPPRDCAAVMSALGLSKNGFFLAVGNLSPNKNLVRLAQAMAKLGYPLPLVIAGAEASGLAKAGLPPELAHSGQVRFLGRVDDDTLAVLYANARAFLWPPLREGFGIPPLEAMRFGIPVLSSNSTAMPEVLAQAPIYFEPQDVEDIARAIAQFLALPTEARDAQVIAGYDRARRFSWDRSAKQLAELLTKRLS